MSPTQSLPARIKNSGPIAWMAQNSVAANLLMFVVLVGGVIGLARTKQEVFPEFDLDIVMVSVPYPGASPAEVEQGITLAAEEAVRGLDGVKRVTSSSSEGASSVSVELLLDADPDKVLNDVKAAIDRVTSFPEESERATVALASRKRQVVSLVLSGDVGVATLHQLAEKARSELLESEEITQVEVEGIPAVEVSVEIPRERLDSLRTSLNDIANQIRLGSVELPGGELETPSGEILVRVADRANTGAEFGKIVLRGTSGGGNLRLDEVAEIDDGFADNDQGYSFNGKNAVRITAYRVGDETPRSVADAVKAYAETLREELPSVITVTVWNDDSEILDQRIDLLVTNAAMGLALVLVVLALFLELRLAFWVACGIPISFLGAFLLFGTIGLSINMVTLFAFIVTLGMVVDDAIIVGEHAFAKAQAGMNPMAAAIEGAQEMAVPVTFAVLTTTAAFAPLMFVPGVMGKIFYQIPAVVICVLVFSVVESFFILPAHVGHLSKKTPRYLRWAEIIQTKVSDWLNTFIEKFYEPVVRFCIDWRYATIAAAVASLILSVGLIAGGVVPFNFFPELEGDIVTANVRLPFGAAESRTRQAQQMLEASARETLEAYGGDKVLRGMFTRFGEGPQAGGPAGSAGIGGSHLVTVELQLVPGEQRDFSSETFSGTWREKMPAVPGAEAVTFNTASGPGAGDPVNVQLTSKSTDDLALASEELTTILREFKELKNVENGYAAGKPQINFRLLPAARSLGLTSNDIARQLRAAFFGAEALRQQRGRNEMKVMVRLPESQRQSEFDLEEFRIRTPRDGFVPLRYVAERELGKSATTIKREDGKRVVNVTAKLAPGAASAKPVLEELTARILPQMREKYPGMSADFVGSQRAQAEAFASLGQNFLFALFIIFALLAIPFRSYLQPLIVMAAIPFGIVGAVMGHLLLGYSLSLISIMGIIALAGVVVNDSLVLIDATNRKRAEGASAVEAIVYGGTRRLRPILLTSLTTFFGLMPMIFETEIQAKFLIPMAISLGFGVLFATLIALLVVPSLYMLLEDVRRVLGIDDPRENMEDGMEGFGAMKTEVSGPDDETVPTAEPA